jgi:hypothetical protein
MTLTIDPKAVTEWPGNCAPPAIELGKMGVVGTLTEAPFDIARGPGDAEIPGITPNVLGSNVEPEKPATLCGRPIVWVDKLSDVKLTQLGTYERPADNPFYVKPREKQP